MRSAVTTMTLLTQPGSRWGPLDVNQGTDVPGQDSPVPNDRPWTLLGVWNVPASD